MRRRPNRELTEEQEQAADEFISGASEPPPSTSPSRSSSDSQEGQRGKGPRAPETRKPAYPWEEPHVREDVKQTYPLRLPEPLHLKLKFLSEETGESMNELCNKAVRSLLEERLEEVL
jgi:hypothetical protein